MGKKFEKIKAGDQLECVGSIIYECQGIDPNRLSQIAIVTDVWFDPVDNREYVGLAKIRSDGEYGRPTEKRTITGLARCGWRYAEKDWINHLKNSGDESNVILFGRKQ